MSNVSEHTVVGEVWLDSFDKGVAVTMGCRLHTYCDDRGVDKTVWVLPGASVRGMEKYDGGVPVKWLSPDDAFVTDTVPSISIRRSSFEPDHTARGMYGYSEAPAPGSDEITIEHRGVEYTGYGEMIEQPHASPFKLSYDVQVAGRSEREMQRILRKVMGRLKPPTFTLIVTDSLGDVRGYDATEVSFSSTSELMEIGRKKAGTMISFQVLGELDILPARETTRITEIPVVDFGSLGDV